MIQTILKGRYVYRDGAELLYLAGDDSYRNKYVRINFTSSGQQETVWIFNILFYPVNHLLIFRFCLTHDRLYPPLPKAPGMAYLMTCRLCLSANTATKIRNTMPCTSCMAWVVSPIMVRPLFSTVYRRAPTMMFSKRTFAPPEMGIPPRTRAIRIWVSSWFPTFAVAEPFFTMLTNAARPVMAPASI